jgi:hypothetical protein
VVPLESVRENVIINFPDTSKRCMHNPINKVKSAGSVLDKKPAKEHCVLTKEKFGEIGARKGHTAEIMRCLIQETSISIPLIYTSSTK